MSSRLKIDVNPDNESFNHAITKAAVAQLQKNGHSVIFHDLYAEQFDPLLPAGEIPTEINLTRSDEYFSAQAAEFQ